MTAKVRLSKSSGRNSLKKAIRIGSKPNGIMTVRTCSGKRTKPGRTVAVVAKKQKSTHMIYCHMYAQEEKDVAKAVHVLAKFSK